MNRIVEMLEVTLADLNELAYVFGNSGEKTSRI
jgi:hypothetical protein